jgi:hypothetical protein
MHITIICVPYQIDVGVSLSKPAFCTLSEVRPHWRNGKESTVRAVEPLYTLQEVFSL